MVLLRQSSNVQHEYLAEFRTQQRSLRCQYQTMWLSRNPAMFSDLSSVKHRCILKTSNKSFVVRRNMAFVLWLKQSSTIYQCSYVSQDRCYSMKTSFGGIMLDARQDNSID